MIGSLAMAVGGDTRQRLFLNNIFCKSGDDGVGFEGVVRFASGHVGLHYDQIDQLTGYDFKRISEG